jgi:hypothetical protein
VVKTILQVGPLQRGQASGDPNVSAAGPHDKPELTNKGATAGTGMLPPPGEADENDMAPGG